MPYPSKLDFYRTDVVGGESNPNSVAPSDAHTTQVPGANNFRATALLYVLDGTSLDVTLWQKDATSGTWLETHVTATVATGTPVAINVVPGALIYPQLGTNTGGVTKFGIEFVSGDWVDPSGGSAGPATAANQLTEITALQTLVSDTPAQGSAALASSTPVNETSTTIASIADKTLTNGAQTQLSSVSLPARRVTVTSDPANTAGHYVRISGSDVSATQGQKLAPGGSYTAQIDNVNKLYAWADVASQVVQITYES